MSSCPSTALPREIRIRLEPDSRLTHYRLLGPTGPARRERRPDGRSRRGRAVRPAACSPRRRRAPLDADDPPRRPRRDGNARRRLRRAAAGQVDLDITVIHAADDTTSDQRINLLGAERGKATAQVETQVPPGRRGVRADQLLRALQPQGKATSRCVRAWPSFPTT